jgi:hypothetical protein
VSVGIGKEDTELLYLLTEHGNWSSYTSLEPSKNTATNLCFFRYNDDKNIYTKTQKCMVHQDSGLITLLPRSTFPGIELLHKDQKHWIPVEKYTKSNDVLVFVGQVMERITQGYIPAAVHRVVREPATERYSMPFEVKPNGEIFLQPIKTQAIDDFKASNQKRPNALTQDRIHMTICDECGQFIIGMRHKCLTCLDYDLCAQCSAKNNKFHFHDQSHSFNSIAKPKTDEEGQDEPVLMQSFLRHIQMKRELNKMCRLIEE